MMTVMRNNYKWLLISRRQFEATSRKDEAARALLRARQGRLRTEFIHAAIDRGMSTANTVLEENHLSQRIELLYNQSARTPKRLKEYNDD